MSTETRKRFDSTTAGAALAERVDEATRQERQRAARALLGRPLLSARGADADVCALVRRHAAWLRDWFARNAGWMLEIDSEFARLRKTPSGRQDGTRGARDPRGDSPFSRRRYVLFCLALAALERSERQTALGKVADDIVTLVAADPALARAGIEFDLNSRDQRRDLVQVMRSLIALRVIERVHGDEEQYLQEKGDVLYRIRRSALAAILNVRRGPSTVEARSLPRRIAAITEEPFPEGADGRNRRMRVDLTRRLLDDPVVYYDEIDEEERRYLDGQRSRLLREIEVATGLVAEVRSEGIAMVDERGGLTDLAMPEEGTDGHFALLLAEHLTEFLRGGCLDVAVASLERFAASAVRAHRGHWRKGVSEAGGERALLARTLERLEALSLVRRAAETVTPLPALGRFALRRDEGDPDADDNTGEGGTGGQRDADEEFQRWQTTRTERQTDLFEDAGGQ